MRETPQAVVSATIPPFEVRSDGLLPPDAAWTFERLLGSVSFDRLAVRRAAASCRVAA